MTILDFLLVCIAAVLLLVLLVTMLNDLTKDVLDHGWRHIEKAQYATAFSAIAILGYCVIRLLGRVLGSL